MNTHVFLGLLLVCSGTTLAGEVAHQPSSIPIRYEPNRHEAELFGYLPAFEPSIVSFDPQNRPYIRCWPKGKNDVPAIQTLEKNGKWVDRDFSAFLPKGEVPGHWTGSSDYRTVVDRDGDLYVLLDAAGHEGGHWYLMHSLNQGKFWTPYRLPLGPMPGEYKGRSLDGNRALLQPNSRAGFLDHPPIVAGSDADHLLMVVPEKRADGSLSIPGAVVIADVSNDRNIRLGDSWRMGWGGIGLDGQKKIASFGDDIFVAWSRPVPISGKEGTPMYIAHYSRKAGRFVGEPRLLGCNGAEIDSHNQPEIALDSKGFIHVLMGSHGTMESNRETVKHLHSLKPLDISAFTRPEPLPASACTYPDLVIDQNDTLHVVCRRYETYAVVTPETFSLGYVYAHKKPGDYSEGFPLYPRSQLAYFRKKVDGEWEFRPLVVSWFGSYVYWYNHISLDTAGQVFVSYKYGPHIDPALAQPADPAILFSPDGGTSWKLVTTEDFLPEY